MMPILSKGQTFLRTFFPFSPQIYTNFLTIYSREKRCISHPTEILYKTYK